MWKACSLQNEGAVTGNCEGSWEEMSHLPCKILLQSIFRITAQNNCLPYYIVDIGLYTHTLFVRHLRSRACRCLLMAGRYFLF